MGEADKAGLMKPDPVDLTPGEKDEEFDPEILRLRAEIQATRERIRGSIEELQHEVDETLDWRRWVREHPWQTVGVAFAIGYLFGSG
ncbi:MAG: hypothetical protein HKN91_06880 [Acidimicrobiia bacterium]|nr:hypothetical protein [Acidimicrobiia bacterium]